MRRPGGAFALALTVLAFAQAGATLVLVLLPTFPGVPASGVTPVQIVLDGAFLFVTPLVGGVVAFRRPDNPTGWLFLAIVLLLGAGYFSEELARRVPPSEAMGYFATVMTSVGNLAFTALFALFATFPTGRLPGRRWRLLTLFAVAGTAGMLVDGLFHPGSQWQPPIPGLPQPLAMPAMSDALKVVAAIGDTLLVIAIVGIVPLVVFRFRNADGVERQQLKWFVYGAAVFGALMSAAAIVELVDAPASDPVWIAAIGSLLLLPVAAGIAILRHGLFDIDLIIRRTVVYAALSAVLLAAYVASVLVLQQVLAPLTPNSSLAVAVSTLVVAALFSPARRRVQAAVDRRFYRQRYSARREIDRFGASLRDEVSVEHVQSLLAATVERTVQPASTSVWLRGTDG